MTSHDGAKGKDREAVRAKVLEGADEVTRKKMDAMLEHSSVVELMAKAQAERDAAEAQPIKPDFLDTEQYQLARRAIGADGEPPRADARAERSERERGSLAFYVVIAAVLALALMILWPLWSAETDPRTEPPVDASSTAAPAPPSVAPTSTPSPAPSVSASVTREPPGPPEPESTVRPVPPPPPAPAEPTGPRFPVQGED